MIISLLSAVAGCVLFVWLRRSAGPGMADERALIESIDRLAARMFGAGLVLLFVVLVLAAIR